MSAYYERHYICVLLYCGPAFLTVGVCSISSLLLRIISFALVFVSRAFCS